MRRAASRAVAGGRCPRCVLAGCSTGSGAVDVNNGGEFRFVAGTPAGTVIAAGRAGHARPTFSGTLLGGGDVHLDRRCTGKVVVLNFWGSWCAPCRVETPEFQQVYARRARPRASRSSAGRQGDHEQFAAGLHDRFGITYPSLYDPRGEVALAFRDYPANAIPSTIVLDRQGRVAAVYTGAVTPSRTCARSSTACSGRGERGRRRSARSSPTARCWSPPLVAALVGLISFASPCVLPLVPGYLVLRRRPGRHRRPDRRAAGARAAGGGDGDRRRAPTSAPRAAGWCSARCCSCSASPRSSSPFGDGVRRARAGCCSSTPRCSNRVFGVVTIVVGLGLPRLAAAAAAHQAARRPARRRAGRARRCSASSSASAGRRASGPTLSAVSRWPSRRPRPPAARCSASPTASGSACRSSSSRSAPAGRSARRRFLRRHARTVTRVGGAVLVVVGLLLVTGAWTELMDWLRSWLATTGLGESSRMSVADTAPGRRRRPPPARRRRGRRVTARLLHWWRRLTAMRTAIVLLFLLALAAVPGSLLPQRSLSQNKVSAYFTDHPTLAPVLDRLYLFDVFSSPWFAAVYLLLFVSLIGCVLPAGARARRALRAAPPPAPAAPAAAARLRRRCTTAAGRRRGARRRRGGAAGPPVPGGPPRRRGRPGALRREGLPQGDRQPAVPPVAGGAAAGPGRRQALGLQGQHPGHRGPGLLQLVPAVRHVLVRPAGRAASDLTPLCVDLDEFRATYEPEPDGVVVHRRRSPTGHPGRRARTDDDRGQRPAAGRRRPGLRDRARLQPDVHGDDARRHEVHRRLGALPALGPARRWPARARSSCPTSAPARTDQLALEGFFAPTGVVQDKILTSVDPRPLAPEVAIVAYEGYLGLDSGIPQSVYSLDPTQIDRGAAQAGRRGEPEGRAERRRCPDGTTIAFTGFKRVRRAAVLARPRARSGCCGSAVALLLGLLGMLLLRRERVFARVAPAPGATAVPC